MLVRSSTQWETGEVGRDASFLANAQVVLAERLAREFAAPVGILNAGQMAWCGCAGVDASRLPLVDTSFTALLSGLQSGPERVQIWHPAQDESIVWLMLSLPGETNASLFAFAGFTRSGALNPKPGWGPTCPDPALLAWAKDVVSRLEAEGKKESKKADAVRHPQKSELQLVSKLIRRLKVSDPPERFQNLANFALQTALMVDAVVWVPAHPSERVIVSGGIERWKAADYRALVTTEMSRSATVQIVNEPRQGMGVRNLVAVEASGPGVEGWLIALNATDRRSFSQVDVELLEPVASLLATQQTNARLYVELKDLLFGVIRALTAAIDAKDQYTSGHSERVARIAVRIAEEMGMSAKQQNDLYLMGLLHDIGKIGIDDQVLKKNGPLTTEEYRVIKEHVEIGVNILRDLHKLRHLLPGVKYHHERIDGNGYPSGLAGEAIPLEARILAVADAFDALTSTRPYRDRMSPGRIDEILRGGAGVQWDTTVIQALFACRQDLEGIRQKGLGESLQVVIDDTVGRNA